MSRRYHTITTEVEVDLDDFEDEDLIEELRSRGVHIPDVEAAPGNRIDPRDAALDVISHLVCKRTVSARNAMRALMESLVPASIAAAAEAIHEGRLSDAICDLDDYVDPSPAATATFFPKPLRLDA